MANTALPNWQLTITLRDSAARETSVSIYVSKTDADAWTGATSDAARDATALGAFVTALSVMTLSNVTSQSISATVVDTAPVTPSTGLRGNKAVLTLVGSTGTKLQTTIPAYSIATLPMESDNITLDVNAGTPASWNTYKNALIAVAKTNQGNDVEGISAGKLND